MTFGCDNGNLECRAVEDRPFLRGRGSCYCYATMEVVSCSHLSSALACGRCRNPSIFDYSEHSGWAELWNTERWTLFPEMYNRSSIVSSRQRAYGYLPIVKPFQYVSNIGGSVDRVPDFACGRSSYWFIPTCSNAPVLKPRNSIPARCYSIIRWQHFAVLQQNRVGLHSG